MLRTCPTFHKGFFLRACNSATPPGKNSLSVPDGSCFLLFLELLYPLKQEPLDVIVLLWIVLAWRIRAFENPDAHRYHQNSHVADGEQENTFNVRAILYSYWLDGSCYCWERIRVQYYSDIESVLLLSSSYMGFLVISVHIRIFKCPNS